MSAKVRGKRNVAIKLPKNRLDSYFDVQNPATSEQIESNTDIVNNIIEEIIFNSVTSTVDICGQIVDQLQWTYCWNFRKYRTEVSVKTQTKMSTYHYVYLLPNRALECGVKLCTDTQLFFWIPNCLRSHGVLPNSKEFLIYSSVHSICIIIYSYVPIGNC